MPSVSPSIIDALSLRVPSKSPSADPSHAPVLSLSNSDAPSDVPSDVPSSVSITDAPNYLLSNRDSPSDVPSDVPSLVPTAYGTKHACRCNSDTGACLEGGNSIPQEETEVVMGVLSPVGFSFVGLESFQLVRKDDFGNVTLSDSDDSIVASSCSGPRCTLSVSIPPEFYEQGALGSWETILIKGAVLLHSLRAEDLNQRKLGTTTTNEESSTVPTDIETIEFYTEFEVIDPTTTQRELLLSSTDKQVDMLYNTDNEVDDEYDDDNERSSKIPFIFILFFVFIFCCTACFCFVIATENTAGEQYRIGDERPSQFDCDQDALSSSSSPSHDDNDDDSDSS
jgi:hypothetical protein